MYNEKILDQIFATGVIREKHHIPGNWVKCMGMSYFVQLRKCINSTSEAMLKEFHGIIQNL